MSLSGETRKVTDMRKGQKPAVSTAVSEILEEIKSPEDLENILLEQVQQAQEIILLIEDEDYSEAKEQLEQIENNLAAIKQYIEQLENGGE